MREINRLIIIFILTICFTNTFSQHKDHSEKYQKDSDKDRFYWQMPNRVIEEIGIIEGMVVADVGSGEGYFALKIAKIVGPNGKVYASDIDKNMLQILGEKASEIGLENIEIVHGKNDNPLLPFGEIDLVLMVNVLHLIEDTKSFLPHITSSLKKNGYLIIVQWDAEKMDFELSDWGAENRKLFTMRTTLRKIYDSNYEICRIKSLLPMQNIYFCQPREKKE